MTNWKGIFDYSSTQPYSKMGRIKHSESANLLWAMRALRLHPLLVSSRWRSLCSGSGGSLTAACTLIGAGAVGALLLVKYAPNILYNSKLSSTIAQITAEEYSCKRLLVEEELTVPGLQNTGNNCFLNVILQALASSKSFVKFMTACAEVTSKAEVKAIVACKELVSMPLAVSVSSLMKELSQLEKFRRTSSPRQVILALRSHAKDFDLASQQDAAEALVHLASAIQEECDTYLQWLKPTFQSFATAPLIFDKGFCNSGQKGVKGRKGGDQLLESWRGHLNWPLEGTLGSSLTCQRCAYQYATQIQFFNDISLSPLQDREGNIIQGCTLENCLDQFTGPEWVDSVKCRSCSHEAAVFSIYSIFQNSKSRTSNGPQSEEYPEMLQSKLKTIEECGCDDDCACEGLTQQHGGIWTNVHANASKQLKIGRSPEVLCFQIQRVVMSEDGALKKLTGHVSFPKVLDLFPYTIAAESCTQVKRHCKTETYKESVVPKTLKYGARSSGEEDSCAPGQTSLPETEFLCKGGADLGLQTRSGSPEARNEHVLLKTCVNSRNSSDTKNGVKTVEEQRVKDEHLLSEQTSKDQEVPFEDTSSSSPLLMASSGSFVTHSPLASSILAQYNPRVFPPQLQTLAPTPYEGQQFSLSTTVQFQDKWSVNNVPKSINRSITRTSKYSRRLLYKLVSVVVHQGGPQCGHYIVYRKMILPICNKSVVLKNASSQRSPAGEQRQMDKGETCKSSMCIGDDASVLLGPAVKKSQPGAFDLLKMNSILERTRDGGRMPCAPQLQDSANQDLLGNRFAQDCLLFANETSKQEEGGDSSEKVKQERLETGETAIALWFRVSDTHVQRVPEHEVLRANAALLFYEQL